MCLLIYLFTGCENKTPITNESVIKNDSIENILITGEFDNTIAYDSIFEEIDIVPLETNKKCLIEMVRKIIVHKNYLYIQNNKRNILVFNQNGNFIRSIGKKGKGPGEILSLRDFEIIDNTLLILDFQSIKRFTLDGIFINEHSFKFFTPNDRIICNPMQFAVFNNNYFFFGGTFGVKDNSNNNLFALYQLNERFKIQERYFPLKYKLSEDYHRFSRNANNISISPPFGYNTIYNIFNDQLEARYFIDFGKKQLKIDIPSDFQSLSEFKLEVDMKYAHSIKNVMQTKDWLYFTFIHKRYTYNVFYSKKDRIPYISKFYPRLDNKLVPFKIDGTCNEEFLALVPVKIVMEDLQKMDTITRSLYLTDETFKSLSEQNNPILYRCRMK